MRFLLVLFMMLSSPCFLFSQIGLKAGINMANIHTEPDSDGLKNLYRFQGGLFYDLKITEKFTTRFNGIYTEKGFKQEFSTGDRDLKLSNVDLGVHLLYAVIAKKNMKLQGFIGPQVGVGISASIVENGTDMNLVYGKDLRRLDFGFDAGFLYDFGGSFIGVDLNFGISNISKDIDERALTHRMLSFVVGYKF